MRELTIVRHAHAERASDDGEDFERELDKRGRREARRMALYLAHRDCRPDHLLTSPAVRTVQTAKTFAHALGFELPRIRHDDRVYLAEADTLLSILRSAPAGARPVRRVGHNPGLSTLARRLDADGDCAELPTAGILSLRFALELWTELDWRTGRRVLFATPDLVEDGP